MFLLFPLVLHHTVTIVYTLVQGLAPVDTFSAKAGQRKLKLKVQVPLPAVMLIHVCAKYMHEKYFNGLLGMKTRRSRRLSNLGKVKTN